LRSTTSPPRRTGNATAPSITVTDLAAKKRSKSELEKPKQVKPEEPNKGRFSRLLSIERKTQTKPVAYSSSDEEDSSVDFLDPLTISPAQNKTQGTSPKKSKSSAYLSEPKKKKRSKTTEEPTTTKRSTRHSELAKSDSPANKRSTSKMKSKEDEPPTRTTRHPSLEIDRNQFDEKTNQVSKEPITSSPMLRSPSDSTPRSPKFSAAETPQNSNHSRLKSKRTGQSASPERTRQYSLDFEHPPPKKKVQDSSPPRETRHESLDILQESKLKSPKSGDLSPLQIRRVSDVELPQESSTGSVRKKWKKNSRN